MVSWQRLLKCGAVALISVSVSGCTDQGTPVAQVNGATISQDDYLTLLEIQQSPTGGGPTGQMVLNTMIEQRLMVQEAKKLGIAPTERELEAAMAELKRNPAFQEELQQTGLTEEKVKELFVEPSLARTRILAYMAKVTDADVRRYYQEHRDELREPAQVQARILEIPDPQKAKEAAQLIGKATFDTIVSTFGDGPASAQTVMLTQQGPSPYPPEVVSAAFKLDEGQTSQVISAEIPPNILQPDAGGGQTNFIVHVTDKLPPREPDLNNPLIRDRILLALIQEKAPTNLSPTALQDMMTRLRKEAAINVVRPSVKQVEQGPPPPVPGLPGMGAPVPTPVPPPGGP